MRHLRFSSLQNLKSINSITSSIVLVSILAWISVNRDISPRPLSRLESDETGVDAKTCAECHAGIVADFATSPHANTLHRGDDKEMLSIFAQQSVEQGERKLSFYEIQNELWFGSDDLKDRRRVDWVFGSGRHALTPVSLGVEGLTQLDISYFADGEFRTTPGIPESRGKVLRLGEHQSEADARRCFGCHVSRKVSDGHSRIQAGLDCSRCHFEAAEHAASDGDVSTIPRWRDLTPLEAINRCGECHRRSDEMTPEEINIDEKHLIRFAPVGLAMSRCFQVANASENTDIYPRLDCITCHDPHLPSRTDAQYFEAICRTCHTPSKSPTEIVDVDHKLDHAARARNVSTDVGAPFVPCSQQPLESACLSCHMPKTDFVPGLRFTDHWIR